MLTAKPSGSPAWASSAFALATFCLNGVSLIEPGSADGRKVWQTLQVFGVMFLAIAS